MIKSERALIIKKILDDTYPRTPVPLNHKDTYTLLIAVLLSAQCTDERVNQITPALFKLAPNPKKMSQMSVEKIYEIIKTIKNRKANMSLGPSITTEQEDKQNRLNELMAKFLAKGGKIEKIPYGMTGEMYRDMKKGKKKKGRKK